MLRYWIDGEVELMRAACCVPNSLRRLAGCGPWEAAHEGGRTSLRLSRFPEPAAWGPEQEGTGGLVYQLADPLPAFDPADWLRSGVDSVPVPLIGGGLIAVVPAVIAGCVIDIRGQLGAPVVMGAYQAALRAFLARGEHEVIAYDDPDLVALLRLAIRSGTTLTDELIHAWELLTTADVDNIIHAAIGG
jgi:hypothetical protein